MTGLPTAYLGKMYVNGLEITHFREIKGKAWPVQVQVTTSFTVACTGGLILHLWDMPIVANCVVISYTLNTRTKTTITSDNYKIKGKAWPVQPQVTTVFTV